MQKAVNLNEVTIVILKGALTEFTIGMLVKMTQLT